MTTRKNPIQEAADAAHEAGDQTDNEAAAEAEHVPEVGTIRPDGNWVGP